MAPIKHVTISNHKIWREPWITKSLSKSMDKCAQLYKQTIKHSSNQKCIDKYKSYQNCLTKIKCKAKINYYFQHCYTLKSNMRKLWQLINNVIQKTIDKMTILD